MWATRPSRTSSTWFRACVLAIVIICFIRASSSARKFAKASHIGRSNGPKALNSCPASTLADRIVVSVKTGATEAADKVPTLVETSLRCVENIILFSDLEQNVGPYHFHDALNSVSQSVIRENSEFKLYNTQNELWKKKRKIDDLPEAKAAAWTLDKYKFIHVLEKTWAMKPDMDWYLFIDADTYLIWPNLVTWLETLDPNKKLYFGSEVVIDGVRFAHGGSGIIISRATMHDIAVLHNGTAAAWDPKMKERCCGDLVLGLALLEHGTASLQDIWPCMSGESQNSMPFGPGTPEYWCRPAFSMHHLSSRDMREFSDFERGRSKHSEPLTHAAIFKELLLKSIPLHQENWDNLASDKGEFGKTGGVSSEAATFEECGKACETNSHCFQYLHHNNTCQIGMSVRRGHKRDPDADGVWRSGWIKTRLAEWVSKQPACNEIIFPTQGS